MRLDPVLLGSLQKIVRQGKWGVTVTVWQDREAVRVQPGYVEEAFGLAVDIGSTTVAMHLCDLRTGAILATASRMNPQVAYGEDLMSRVSYCDDRPDGLATLHGAIIAALNELAAQAAAEAGITTDAITDIVLVGNTVMHHILLNVPPRELGQSPFGPAISDAVDIKARDLGLKLAPGAQAHVLPVEAGHVGSDNVGGDPGRGAGQGAIRRGVADRRCGHQRRASAGQPGSAFLGLQPDRPRRSRARRSATGCARRPARSSGCASIPRRWMSASRSSAATSGAILGTRRHGDTETRRAGDTQMRRRRRNGASGSARRCSVRGRSSPRGSAGPASSRRWRSCSWPAC